jgi:predicted amidohydrolase YtcJ
MVRSSRGLEVSANGSAADLILAGGAVYTVDAARRWAEAVAIRDGRIVAVGADRDVRPLAGSRTQVHDLRGRMVLPGFQDAHIHPPPSGLDMLRCDLSGGHSMDEYRAIIGEYASSHPDAEWILGAGWSMDVFPGGTPTKDLLDELVGDRPAFLPNRDGHGAWVSSRALALAGIDARTADPPDGRIERDANGEPSGTLHEGAMSLVEDIAPRPTTADMLRGLLTAQAYLHSLGITGWQDAIVGGSYDSFDAYVQAAESEELTGRVVGALWWERHEGPEQIDGFLDKRRKGVVGRFAATSVKIMQDGVCENFTAGMIEPYLDRDGRPTANRGLSFVDPGPLRDYVTALDAAGFQVHFHAIGERAVREALDAFEAARRTNGPNDNRHHISHIQVVHPDDLPRFRELGVIANGQPLWACSEPQMTELTIPFLGPERSTWQYPFGSLLRSGAQLAFGSDWAVSSCDPLEEMHVAVNRTVPPTYPYGGGAPGEREPFLPAERIPLPDAIHAFTMGSAHVNHLDETGSVEVGKLADLVVLDRNLFEHPAEEISAANVQLTLVEGAAVYEAPDFA